MSKIDRQRRPRRIAADEAHTWARNLRLGNHHGKSVLKALSLYVNGDGWGFPGVEQLGDDCELSADTVRRRLVWLEEIGAILRRPQWINSKGCRNSDGEGRRTSDLIKMMVDAGNDHLIEARARGEIIDEDDGGDCETEQISPRRQQGLSLVANTASPAPALGQPSHCGEGLISEPEPELSPLPPSRGREGAPLDDHDEEPEQFASAWSGWRGHEVMRRDLALAEFRKLSPEDQQTCRAAIGPYNVALDRNHRNKSRENFHIWIRRRGFEEFKETPITRVHAAHSDEARAIAAVHDLAGKLDFINSIMRKADGSIGYRVPITPRLLAMAKAPPREQWVVLTAQQAAAWEELLGDFVLVQMRKHMREGSFAPWPWPPSKDGKVYNEVDDV